MGNAELRVIAQELVNAVQATSSVDWWRKQNVRMKMRVTIKKILKRHGFPPDLQEESIKKVLVQAEVLAKAFS